MNYTWLRADRVKVGNVEYFPVLDKTITSIAVAGDLALRFGYADGSHVTVARNTIVMLQVCHRRYYERGIYPTRVLGCLR